MEWGVEVMNRFWVCLSSTFFTSLVAIPAFAQTSDVDYALEEVVVTAELREVNLQKVSTSIQVTSGEELRKEGKRRIDEIMQGAVGIQMQDSQNGMVFFVRGVDGGGTASGDVVSTPIIVDGVAQSRSEAVRGGTLDLARAEVMRGPQSTTLGANSLSGAVSLVTNKPTFNYEASTNLDVGNYHGMTMEGVMNVPFSDNQAIRIAFTNTKRDGYYSNGAGGSDLRTARIKHRWQPTSNLDITTTVQHQNIGGNGVSQLTLLAYGTYVPYRPGGAFNAGSTQNQFSLCKTSTGDWVSKYPQYILDGNGKVINNPLYNPDDPSQFGNCLFTGNTGTVTVPADPLVPGSLPTTIAGPGGSGAVDPANSLVFNGYVASLPTKPLKPLDQTPIRDDSLLNLSCLPGDDLLRNNCYGRLQNTLGGVPEFSGVPTAFYPMFDGTNFRTRENAWDDGTQPSVWSNSPYANTDTELASVEINWTTDLGALTFLPSYQSTHFTQNQPYRNYQSQSSNNYQRTKIADLRFNSNSGDALQWQVGLYYKDDRQSLKQLTTNAPGVAGMGMGGATGSAAEPGTCNLNKDGLTVSVPATNSIPGTDVVLTNGPLATVSPCYSWSITPRLDRISKNAFFNAEYALLDTVRLIGGARFADETAYQYALNPVNGDRYNPFATCKDNGGYRLPECLGGGLTLFQFQQNPNQAFGMSANTFDGYAPALDNVKPSQTARTRWSATTFRGGLEWDFLPEAMLYGVYSTGFNPGAVGGMVTNIASAVTLEQVTLGLKSQFFDNRLQFNTEGFMTTYHNRPVDGSVIVYGGEGSDETTCTIGMGSTQLNSSISGSGWCMALGSPTMKDFTSLGIDMDATWLISPVDRLTVTAEFLRAKYEAAPYFLPTTTIGSVSDTASSCWKAWDLAKDPSIPTADRFNYNSATQTVTAPRVYRDNGTINPWYVQFVAGCGGGTAGQPLPISPTDQGNNIYYASSAFDEMAKGFIGTTLQNSPKYSATLNYSHTFNLAGGSQVIPKISGIFKTQYWSLGGGGPGNSGINVVMNAANDPSSKYYLAWQQDYTTWDFSTQWNNPDGKFTVNAYVKNFTNEVVLTSYTFSSVSLQPPRTWGATFTANF